MKFKPEDFSTVECADKLCGEMIFSTQQAVSIATVAQAKFEEWFKEYKQQREFDYENAIEYMQIAVAFLEDTLHRGPK